MPCRGPAGAALPLLSQESPFWPDRPRREGVGGGNGVAFTSWDSWLARKPVFLAY